MRLHANYLLAAAILMTVLITGLVTSLPLLALTGDNQQPIQIHSQQQSLDLKTNYVTFTGQVVITQGTIDIHADKVVVTRSSDQPNQHLVEAYGHPATFYQLMDDQQPIKGQCRKIQYDAKKTVIILQQQAVLQRLDSCIQGETIIYDISGQKVHAASGPNQQVRVVLQPEQLSHEPHKPSQ